MTTDLTARIEQLQQELDEAQQIANNNYRLYTTAKAQRDELLGHVGEWSTNKCDCLGDIVGVEKGWCYSCVSKQLLSKFK